MTKYEVRDDQTSERFAAKNDEAAKAYAEDWLREGDWDRTRTLHLDAYVFRIEGKKEVEVGRVEVSLEPQEPRCTEDEHDWQAPIEIVGGIKENPGVWGHGGGVIIRECCMHCGCAKVTDTWAQDNCGRQGLTSVEYEPDAYRDALEAYRAEHEEEMEEVCA